MLIIRPEQFEKLSQAVDRRFEARLGGWLREHFAVELDALPPEDPRLASTSAVDRDAAFVKLSVARAEKYGIEESRDVAVFVALILANLRFRQAGSGQLLDGLRRLLDRRDADGPSKIALVLHELKRLARSDERLRWLAGALVDAHDGAAWKI